MFWLASFQVCSTGAVHNEHTNSICSLSSGGNCTFPCSLAGANIPDYLVVTHFKKPYVYTYVLLSVGFDHLSFLLTAESAR